MKYIHWFNTVGMDDIGLVGGKNASLGAMITELSSKGIRVPMGFAISSKAYWRYLEYNKLVKPMRAIMSSLNDVADINQLQQVGHQIRELMLAGVMPNDIVAEIAPSYLMLSQMYGQETADVAVRSSATAEDLPHASFAGQQETYLNIHGLDSLIEACIKCFASLFTDRAIVYRTQQSFDHFKVALSIGIQKMVRSDLSSSGVAFSLDPESGYSEVVTINAAYGLGESIVQGIVIPDEFIVHKQTLKQGFAPIIKKYCGNKQVKIVYTQDKHESVQKISVPIDEQHKFSLSDQEILALAKDVLIIEQFYSDKAGHWVPMDIEWGKDGLDGQIYILQARPETIHGSQSCQEYIGCSINVPVSELKTLVTGRSVGQKIAAGRAVIASTIADIHQVHEGDILVTDMTDPDWVPIMKKATGIITNRGGRTCHAAIVSRELGLPAIVGTVKATEVIKNGSTVTIDCSRGDVGFVYDGAVPFSCKKTSFDVKPNVPVDVMVNLADPDSAFKTGMLPVSGVGLARIEFIINNSIKIHPMALVKPEKVLDDQVLKKIDLLTNMYATKQQYFIELLAQGIGMIAAAFYPRPVIVRSSDFKSNEYRNLIGGSYFEPIEENPMIGFRGAYRYYHENYKEAFALECAAIVHARTTMGFKNIKLMIPFVRTIDEAKHVIQTLKSHGLERGKDGLELVMMCEIPSNVILMSSFCEFFDGFSIGSNDLTQLTLGVDRDSELLATAFDERDEAVLAMMKMAIIAAHRHNRFIGICGQAPSDYPEIAQFLIDVGIDSISLNPDSVIPFFMNYC